MQTKEEKLKIFKQAIKQAFEKLKEGTAPTKVAMEYDIPPSIPSSILKAQKDPQISTIFRLAEAYNIDAEFFIKMIKQELPEGFTFSEI